MKVSEVLSYFKTSKNAYTSLNPPVAKSTFSMWKKNGIPELWQRQFEELTGGKLKIDPQFRLKRISKFK